MFMRSSINRTHIPCTHTRRGKREERAQKTDQRLLQSPTRERSTAVLRRFPHQPHPASQRALLTLAKSRGKLAAKSGFRPMLIGCCCAAKLEDDEEATAARVPNAGAIGTKALAPATRLKNAREVFIVPLGGCEMRCVCRGLVPLPFSFLVLAFTH